MIITRTPFRLSFFGGGTDLKTFYSKTDGEVLSTAINKYIYVVVKKKLGIVEHKYRINWSTVEFTNDINKIKNPIARECLKYFRIDYPIEITTFADVPANTGLGSSSAFAVGLVNALFALKGKMVSKYEIASTAAKIEIELLGRKIGKQDHFACCYGNLNNFVFKSDESVVVNPIPASSETLKKLENNMILFFTKQKRNSESVLKNQYKIQKNQFIKLKQMKDLVEVSKNMVLKKNFSIKEFGKLLDKNWQLKKQSNKFVSNNLIEKYYKTAINNGAYGGKLLGAGNGGFLLFIANKPNQKKIFESLKSLEKMYIRLDYSGTRITYIDKIGEENVR
jgi:D-glycero-alpha-D-manno-heptose-7-phosphate kinase